MLNTTVQTLEALAGGRTPPDEALQEFTVGREHLLDFLVREYLEGFIRDGGGKIKFFVGREGCGKTHHLRYLAAVARERGYLVSFVDARTFRLNKFQSFYQSVLAELDIAELVARYCAVLVEELGYQAEQVPAGTSFLDWATAQGQVPKIVRTQVLKALEGLYRNRRLNHHFALAFIHLCQDHLGLQTLPPEQRAAVTAWLRGENVPGREVHRLHIYSRIDRYNARHMLRSLTEVVRRAGYTGMFVAVDNLDVIAARGPSGRPLYTRAAREEVYESLRQLVDDVEGLENVLICFALHLDLLLDPKVGIESYEPLKLRLQNEIASDRLNKFADLIDLDLAGRQFLGVEELLMLGERINGLRRAVGWPPVVLDRAKVEAWLGASGAVAPVRRVVMTCAAPAGAEDGESDA